MYIKNQNADQDLVVVYVVKYVVEGVVIHVKTNVVEGAKTHVRKML